LRHRGVLDLIRARGGAVPDEVTAGQLRGGAEALGDAGQFQPGRQETRRLGALAGRGDDQHPLTLPCRGLPPECRTVRSYPLEICRKALIIVAEAQSVRRRDPSAWPTRSFGSLC